MQGFPPSPTKNAPNEERWKRAFPPKSKRQIFPFEIEGPRDITHQTYRKENCVFPPEGNGPVCDGNNVEEGDDRNVVKIIESVETNHTGNDGRTEESKNRRDEEEDG